MYQSSSPSPTPRQSPALILNRTFSKLPHHFPTRPATTHVGILSCCSSESRPAHVWGRGRGGVTTHAAVKLRNAGQLGQAWRYCVVKTFPSPSISFPSAWQHAPRPAPPPMCSGAYRAWPGCVTRVRPRGVGWEVGAGVARVISDILRGECLECIGA